MTADETIYNQPYRVFMAIVGVLMLGWAIAYGYANYQADQCIQGVQARLDSLKARVDAGKTTTDQRK